MMTQKYQLLGVLLVFWICGNVHCLPLPTRINSKGSLLSWNSPTSSRRTGGRTFFGGYRGRTSSSTGRPLLAAFKNFADDLVTRKNVFVFLGTALLTLPPIIEIYSRMGVQKKDLLPEDFLNEPIKGNWQTVEHASLIFHGAGGQDQYTDALLKKLRNTDSRNSYSSIIDWSEYSTNLFQASFNGQRVGSEIVKALRKKAPNLKTCHILGISVGAFAATAAVSEVKSQTKSIYTQLTLLDPFTQRGIFDVGYGDRNFCTEADYVQQYLNTDDPVPSTNSPLSGAVCYDITSIRPKDEVSFGHDWPVAYYARYMNVGLVPKEEQRTPGTIVDVPQLPTL